MKTKLTLSFGLLTFALWLPVFAQGRFTAPLPTGRNFWGDDSPGFLPLEAPHPPDGARTVAVRSAWVGKSASSRQDGKDLEYGDLSPLWPPGRLVGQAEPRSVARRKARTSPCVRRPVACQQRTPKPGATNPIVAPATVPAKFYRLFKP